MDASTSDPMSETESENELIMITSQSSSAGVVAMDVSDTNDNGPFIEQYIVDENAGSIQFINGFQNRYGNIRPQFYSGTLDQAVKAALYKPIEDKVLIAIYLHDSRSQLSNTFCTDVLCHEVVAEYLNTHFVIWGWDMTYSTNINRLLQSTFKVLGQSVVELFGTFRPHNLPVLVVVTRFRFKIKIMDIIYGASDANDSLMKLTRAQELVEKFQNMERLDEIERGKRLACLMDQNDAYMESLKIDQAKEEEKKKKEMEENAIQEQERQVAADKETSQQRIAALLPTEPEPGDQVISVKFRLPSGEVLERRFLTSNNLQVLFDYLFSKGFSQQEYKVITFWPKKDLTTLDGTRTLQEVFLHARETLTIEENKSLSE